MRRKRKVVVAAVGILVLGGVLGTTTMSATTEFVSPTALDSGSYDGEWVNLEGVATDLDRADGTIRFVVTDENESVPVVYEKPMPETLQNGRIVVAKGKYVDGRLDATKLSVRAHEGGERPDSE
jgi:cytochrome c-type biogenesis protein CcmE